MSNSIIYQLECLEHIGIVILVTAVIDLSTQRNIHTIRCKCTLYKKKVIIIATIQQQ